MTTTTAAPAMAQDYAVGLTRLAQYRELPNGSVEYYDDAVRAWYWAPKADVIALGRMAPRDAYSLWCADTSHDEIADPDEYNAAALIAATAVGA